MPVPPFAVFSNGETLVELLIDLDDKVGAIFWDRDTFDRLFALHFLMRSFSPVVSTTASLPLHPAGSSSILVTSFLRMCI